MKQVTLKTGGPPILGNGSGLKLQTDLTSALTFTVRSETRPETARPDIR
jgi:hypothetical protein